MVSTHCPCKAQPSCAAISTQADLPRVEITVQTLGCMEIQQLEVTLAPEGSGGYYSWKDSQLEELFKQVAVIRGARQSGQYLGM